MSKVSGRAHTRFVCQSWGESFLRWEGQCRACSAWNSLVETQVRSEPRPRSRLVGEDGGGPTPSPTRLIDVGEPERPRIPAGIGELDRVLGGGLVAGSVVLLGGEPGIGKSTLLLEAAAGIAALVGPDRVLYATGEESIAQVRLRAERLGLLFQITDDLLDVTASVEDIGKTPGKDARSRKATYPSLYGLEATRVRAQAVSSEACHALDRVERSTERLRAIARFILERRA